MANAELARPDAAGGRAGSRVAVWLLAAFGMVSVAMAVWVWSSSPVPRVTPAGDQPISLVPALTADQHPATLAVQPYQTLLSNQVDDWRLVRLAENPKILVIEFPTLGAQGRALNRLATLIEKNNAPRDRVLSDEGLAKFIQQVGDTPATFFFGHDYPAEAVARFFTMAVSQQLLLNADELRLGTELLAAGVLKEESDKLIANPDRQALVSFTAVQKDDPGTKGDETVDARRREAILLHELSHGEFFTNADYRKHCWTFWQHLSDTHRKLLTKFLAMQGYDPGNEELMVNEAQAYLMHTPDTRAFSAEQLGISAEQFAVLKSQFNQGAPKSIFSSIGR